MVLPVHFHQIHRICCIGAREATVMSMAVIAERHPQVTVTIVDYDANLVQRWQNQNNALAEPGFFALLNQVRNLNLFFSPDVENTINQAEMIFIGVDIPIKRWGIGARTTPDRKQWERAIRSVMTASQASKVIVEKSVAIDEENLTMRLLGQRTQAQQNAVEFAVFSNPDFYNPGNAIQELYNPTQVLIALKSDVGDPTLLEEMYGNIAAPQRIIVLDNYLSVEIAKVSTDFMVASKMTTANSLAALCSQLGANFHHVRRALGNDNRININYMDTQLGIGGDEMMKSTIFLKNTLQKNGLRKEAKAVNEIVKLNKSWSTRCAALVLNKMVTLEDKVVTVFGVTYKRNFADLKNSRAIAVCKSLLTEGARIRIFDPLVGPMAIMACFTKHRNRVHVIPNQHDACNQAHAAVCLVNQNFQFNYQGMFDAMVFPPYLFVVCDLNLNANTIGNIRIIGFQLYVYANQIT